MFGFRLRRGLGLGWLLENGFGLGWYWRRLIQACNRRRHGFYGLRFRFADRWFNGGCSFGFERTGFGSGLLSRLFFQSLQFDFQSFDSTEKRVQAAVRGNGAHDEPDDDKDGNPKEEENYKCYATIHTWHELVTAGQGNVQRFGGGWQEGTKR